jgi:hypothetical protein
MKSLTTSRYLAGALLLACSAGISSAADYPTTVSGYGPIGYWRFNETAAAPALNIAANSSVLGAAANGYIVLDVTKGQAGAVGNCVRLNNVGNTVGHCGSKIDIPYLPPLNPKSPFSVEFWVKPGPSLGGDGTGFCPLSCFNPNWFGGGNRSGWLFYVNNNGVWNFRLGLTSGYAGNVHSTSGNAAPGVWQHIVATYDGSTIKLYANGVSVGNPAESSVSETGTGWLPNTQMALRIGGTGLFGDNADQPWISAAGIAGNRGFDGYMDEVALYTNVLSASTVAAHYSAASTNNAGYGAQILAGNPIGYWNMDEPTVTHPDPATYPIVSNIGSAGNAADGTNMWGSLTAQNGSGYAGMGAGNKALFLNGESGFVALKDAPSLHFSGQITMMAWIKPSVKDVFRNVIAHGWDGDYGETFLRISRSDDGTGYGVNGVNFYEVGVTDGGANTYYDSATFPIPAGDIGNWVHIAGTYNGTSWNLYRNGVLVATKTSDNGARDVTNRWSIGARSDEVPSGTASGPHEAEGLFFGGFMDEPAIFNTALLPGDINTIYNSAQVPPVISQSVQNPGTVFKGSSASFSVWAEGSPTLTYLWTSNGVSTGVTTTNYTASNLAVGTPTIAVIVTNPYGSTTNAVTFPVVAAAPAFTSQPTIAPVRYNGRPFVLTVAVSGSTPMSLQWKTNGVPIPGATSATYSNIASPSVAFSYSCTASNEAGQVTSTPLALTVLPVPGGYGGAVIASGPKAYWRLNEASGSIAHDAYNGNDGAYNLCLLGQLGYASDVDSDTSIVVGPSAGLTGSGSNSYVGSISGTAINFQGHTNFSIEAWVNGPGQNDEATIIAKGHGSSGTTATEQFSLDVVGGKYHFYTRGSANAFFEAYAVSGPDGTWQHVVGVYDDTGGTVHIYVNGQEEGSGAVRGSGLRVSSDVVTIGSKHLGNDPNFDANFNGNIDEVAVYPYALSAGDVSAHYSAAYGPSLPPKISKQPSAVTNYVSLPATISVGAFGTVPLSYQWKKAGVPITDATKSALTFAALLATDAGSYSVTITNVNGTTNSASATLTVLDAPITPPAIPGLVLHLAFDGDLTDASGRGNSGAGMHVTYTSTNAANPGANSGANPDFYYNDTGAPNSVLGKSLHYHTATTNGGNGTVTNSFFVSLGSKPDLKFSSNINFSVSFWIKFPANIFLGDLPFFCSANNSYGGQGYTFAPSYNLGSWSYSLDGVVQLYGPDHAIDDGSWHNMIHTFDRAGLASTYLDGKLVHTRSAVGAGDLDNTNPTSIGQDPYGAYPEEGSYDIDDIGVWHKVLTPLEAASIYMAAAVSGLSYVGAPVTLNMDKSGPNLIFTWNAGAYLQSADNITGPWTDIRTAKSPFTVAPTAARKFYRVRI